MPGSKEPSLKEGGGNGNGTGTPSPVPSVIKESAGLGFTPDWRFKIAFGTLSVVTLVVALDATSLSVALPVCLVVSLSKLLVSS
jgi:hypothetical protein